MNTVTVCIGLGIGSVRSIRNALIIGSICIVLRGSAQRFVGLIQHALRNLSVQAQPLVAPDRCLRWCRLRTGRSLEG